MTWTRQVGGKETVSTAVQDTKAAAERLVSNLLRDIAPGLTKGDGLTVKLQQ